MQHFSSASKKQVKKDYGQINLYASFNLLSMIVLFAIDAIKE